MKEKLQALQTFWSGFGMPALAEGETPPEGRSWILYEAKAGWKWQRLPLKAEAWFQGPEALILRAAFLDSLAEQVPERGRICPAGKDWLLLERDQPFVECIGEEDEVHGVRIRLWSGFY